MHLKQDLLRIKWWAKHCTPGSTNWRIREKLALLIKDIDPVDQADLKHVEYKRMEKGTKNDLLFKKNFTKM